MKDQSVARRDGEIVRLVLEGETRAFARLVEIYGPPLFGLAFHLCRDYDEAGDLAQETLITAFEHLDRLRDPDSFPSWTAGILRNKFRNLARKRKIPMLSLDSLLESGFDPPEPENQADAKKEEDLRAAARCVDQLPGKLRETLLLRYAGDLSYKEMAEALGLSVAAVTSRLSRARAALVGKAKEAGLLEEKPATRKKNGAKKRGRTWFFTRLGRSEKKG